MPDLDDLLGRGQDERRETFPRLLPQQAQSAAGGDGAPHRLVVGKSFEHGGQIGFGLEKIAEPLPVGNRRGGFGADAVARLRQPDKMFSDNAFPRISILPPAENLAGVERRGQIVIADGQECFHRLFQIVLASSSTRFDRGRGRRRGRGGQLISNCSTPRDGRGGRRGRRF